MPNSKGPGSGQPEKRSFISEKIVKPPMTKKQIAKRALLLVLTAAIFGVVAAVTFVVSRPYAERYLSVETESESTPVTIPKDEPETTAPTTQAPEETSVQETEPIEEVVKSAMERYKYTAEDIDAFYGTLRSTCQEADKGIVTVHSVKKQVDWFDNPVENTGLFAGAVVAVANGEMLVLTPEGAVEEADSIRVAFSDGTEVAGSIKQVDQVSGMAVVSIPCAELSEDLLHTIKTIELGNSYAAKQGDLVMAVGSPAGLVHSTDYGFISYITRNVQITDGFTRVIYADLRSNAPMGTFLINSKGEIIGWATDAYKSEGIGSMTVAMAISDYKSILEKLTNGIPVPYFGVTCQEVSRKMQENGMPPGLYVVDVASGSPAYNAGIQSGDIITSIGVQEMATMKDFQMKLDSLKTDELVPVTVQRNGREEYKELEYQVTIGAR